MFPITDDLFPECLKHVDADIDWERAAADFQFKRKLSEVARDILKKAGSEEESLENLQKVAKDLVRKWIEIRWIFISREQMLFMKMSCTILLFISFQTFLRNL